MLVWLLPIGGVLLLLGLLVFTWSARLRERSGLPSGRIVLSDTVAEQRGKPLYSERYALSGTPDYVVVTSDGTIPVEVKPGRTDLQPHESHLLQVLAYCLLIEESMGKRPPYGLLRYSSDTFKVDYNDHTRAHIVEVLAEMRSAAGQGEVSRSHNVPGRCKACAYHSVCDQSLWQH